MKAVLSAVLAMCVVGCGVEAGEEAASVSAAQCRLETCPPEDPDDSDVYTYRTLSLKLWNAAPGARLCQYTYSFTRWDGGTESGAVVAASWVEADGWRSRSVNVPLGRTVALTASCWLPDRPRASTTLTTLPMDRARTCRAIYDEAYGPNVALPCWEG